MDLELLDMLEDHIRSFGDEAKLRALMDAYSNLCNKGDSSVYSFIVGSMYGSCLFIRDSYSPKKRIKEDDEEFNQWFNTHIKGFNLPRE